MGYKPKYMCVTSLSMGVGYKPNYVCVTSISMCVGYTLSMCVLNA